MSEALATKALDDDEIQIVAENSHGVYYKVGKKVTVVWYPGHKVFLCLTCVSNKCHHTRRVERWIEDAPAGEVRTRYVPRSASTEHTTEETQ
jgi:hypothetical protein